MTVEAAAFYFLILAFEQKIGLVSELRLELVNLKIPILYAI